MSIALIGAAQIVFIWQLTFERSQYEQAEASRHEYIHNANLAAVIEEHTDHSLKSVEQSLDLIEKTYRQQGSGIKLKRLQLDGDLSFKAFSDLAVINEAGLLVAGLKQTAPVKVSGEDALRHHQALDSHRLYIGKPIYSQVSGTWSIPVSRRINRPDGAFAGVVMAGIDPAYFTDFYLKTDVGTQGIVSLIGLDGVVRARRVGKQTTTGDNVSRGPLLLAQARQPEGSLLGVGGFDGVTRLFSYRTLKDYPLLVAVGTSQAQALAEVFQREKKYYANATLATLAVLLIGTLLIWLLMRSRALQLTMHNTQALQRASFNLSAIGMSYLDRDGRYLLVNDKLCRLLGCSATELTGSLVDERVFPADRAAHQMLLDDLRTARQEQPSSMLEIRYLHQNGSLIWALISVSLVLKTANSPSYFISALQDITERKRMALALRQRDQQLSSAFEDSVIGMGLSSPEGRWLKVNRALCQMLGYTEAEMMSASVRQITHPDDMAISQLRTQQLLQGENAHFQVEKRYVHKQGHSVWTSLAVSLVRDEDDQPLHFIAQLQDINQRKQAQDEIRRLNVELEERVRQRTRELQFAHQEIAGFSHSVAHDLRQPFSSIMGFSHLLERELKQQTSERGKHYLTRIRAGVHQIGELTDALLALVKLSSIDLRWEKIDLSVMAQNLVARRMLLEPQRQVQCHIHPKLQTVGDAQLLTVVMDSLIGNAWKFSSKMPQTTIEVGSERGPGQDTIYFVRDQGVGFDMAYAAKLFDNFQRLHSPSEFPGNGTGLASAQRIIRRHGGRIWALSTPGRGATFYFTLGAAPPQAAAAAA
ncbi:PAS domain S-box-containing protein [Polaromonas sp. OV174]|nr:PAS domain S-box-containing protein [Polaromonas sp. OV174]